MIVFSHQIQDVQVEYDVCIVGAGAAGISLALEFTAVSSRICLVEAGGFGYDKNVQRLFEGSADGEFYPQLRDTRLGAFGGTTNVWAGWCRPLDEADFQGRSSEIEEGWPFDREELVPFYRRAHGVCGLGEFEYDPEYWEHKLGASRFAIEDERIVHRMFYINALNFGDRYRRQFEQSRNIYVLLHAPAVRCHFDDTRRRVKSLEVLTLTGNQTFIKARYFVLAAGGIENARLLLVSGKFPFQAVGNGSGLVGHYFTDHAFLDFGLLILKDKTCNLDYYFPQPVERTDGSSRVRGTISLSETFVKHEKLQNGAIFFHPRYESHLVFCSKEVKALLRVWDKLRHRAVPGDVGLPLARAIGAPGKIGMALARRFLVHGGSSRTWLLRGMFETESRYDNRVTLSSECDQLNRPRPHIKWNLSDRDLSDMRRVVHCIDEAFRRAGIGQIQLAFPDTPSAWRHGIEVGKHHMGTTRMHPAPRHGVVDENAKVHGVSNLFVTGSSVFPKGGYANPTLTIVALAIRLGDHLKRVMSDLTN